LINYSLLLECCVDDGVVTLDNIGEVLRADPDLLKRVEAMIRNVDGVKNVIITDKKRSHGQHVNPFHNID